MYKILSILLLVVISMTVMAQEKSEKHFTPKPLKVPGGDGNSLSTVNPQIRPNEVEMGKLDEFINTNSSFIQKSSPDNMPCVVPNMTNIAAIPNAFSSGKSIPYMPNSMPLTGKSPSR